jgi:tripartite-type tricarboxylate transporter receptor subunit TctC
MMRGVRSILWLIALCVVAATSASVQAQAYPTRPVRLVVGFTPGGGVDINARLLGSKLSELLGQSVIVDNRPGAGTNIANELVAKSAPDGHTLLVASPAVAINMALYKNLPYDTLRDFVAVSIFSESPNILVVNSSSPAKSMSELIALARAKPGILNYSSAGTGTTQHLAGELLKLRTGTNIVHVPYKGSAPSLTALIAGDVDLSFANVPAILQHVKSGRLRPLASTGTRRSELMPDVPTMQEVGLTGVEMTVWYGVLAPAATPRDIVNKLSEAINKAARSPDIKQRLLDQGAEPVGNTPSEFDKILREEVAKWSEVIRTSGIQVE